MNEEKNVVNEQKYQINASNSGHKKSYNENASNTNLGLSKIE